MPIHEVYETQRRLVWGKFGPKTQVRYRIGLELFVIPGDIEPQIPLRPVYSMVGEKLERVAILKTPDRISLATAEDGRYYTDN